MALISLQNLNLAFGGPPLFQDASLQIEKGDRICLVGRNGEGKSTLLKIIAGTLEPDSGDRAIQGGVSIGWLPQQVPLDLTGTVEEVVEASLDGLDEMDQHQRVQKAISKLGLESYADFASLSGGQKRRALLARALVQEPEVLLLDEPTNHLDIESINWLENVLLRYEGAVLFVTHDRSFLQTLATRIVELDRGSLRNWACGYERYLQLREETLAAEEKQNARFDKKLAQEEVWIRQGIKARRTRNEGRVRALEKLRNERGQRRGLQGTAKLNVQQADRSGQKVIELTNLHYAWDDEISVHDFSTTIFKGDKIGIIGPNGCGKTTLLRLLLKQLSPDAGEVKHGTNLEVAYFDQHRGALDDNLSIAENLVGDGDFLQINGNRRHVISYLEDFLFPPQRSRSPVRMLSGGERNRLLLAKLFSKPANLLILDEPTNDLDAETLELLDALLVDFKGTVLLVSHDRTLINNVVTSTFVFEGDGKIGEFPGGYDDWISQRAKPKKAGAASAPRTPAATPRRKLSNREREELKKLPKQIEQLETEQTTLGELLSDPDFFKKDPETVRRTTDRSQKIPGELETAYARWEALETQH